MGLFSFVGDLFGGGDTTVQQQASNQTDVTVNSQVNTTVQVDTEKFAEALTLVGSLSAEGQKALADALNKSADAETEANDKALAFATDAWKQVTGGVKSLGEWAVIGVVAYVAYRWLWKGK